MKVEHIDHIHITVKDMDKAAALFEDLLGVKFSKETIDDKYAMKSRIAAVGQVAIELIQGTSPNSEATKFVERRGEGVQAISFKVSNLDEAVTELKAKGIRVLPTEIEFPLLRERLCHPKDTCGVMFELCEYEEGHPIALALVYSQRGEKWW